MEGLEVGGVSGWKLGHWWFCHWSPFDSTHDFLVVLKRSLVVPRFPVFFFFFVVVVVVWWIVERWIWWMILYGSVEREEKERFLPPWKSQSPFPASSGAMFGVFWIFPVPWQGVVKESEKEVEFLWLTFGGENGS